MNARAYVPSRPEGTGGDGTDGRGSRWSDSLSVRIALWYGTILGLCLVAYSLAVGFSIQRHLEQELDRRLHEEVELVLRSLVLDEAGRPRLPEDAGALEHDDDEGWEHRVEVWRLSGEPVLAIGSLRSLALEPPREGDSGRGALSLALPGGPVRVLTRAFPGERYLVRAVVSETGAHSEIRKVWLELLALSAGVLVLGGLGGAALARRSLKPLSLMAGQARRITAQDLHERLPAQDTVELEQLRRAFNEALEQLERSFDQLRRFIADASHELRTPLTALRSVGEVGLHGSATVQEAREVIGSMLEEVDRMARLAEELLSLTRAEAGEARLHLEPVDLSQLARDVVEHLCVLAEERQQILEADVSDPVLARADRIALRQAVVNLVDNAIKYSPDCTLITLATGRRRGTAFIEVRDEGPGLKDEDREKVFERFYRVDKSRSQQTRGSGLGLSLVKWTVEAHGGWVEVDAEPGRGSTFRLVLPEATRAG